MEPVDISMNFSILDTPTVISRCHLGGLFMKKVVLMLLFVVLTAAAAFGRGFQRVYSQDGNDVWAVGDSGNVFRSFNGGATWGTYPLGSGLLRSVVARSSFVGIVGDGGTYYRSVNNGESFSSQTLALGTTLRTIAFASDSIGWIGGNSGTLLKTTDAGATWASLSAPTAQHIQALRFTSTTNGWLVGGSGTIMQTTNGGSTWAAYSVPGLVKDLYSVDVNGSTLYVVGAEASAAKSTTGGASWTKLDFKIDSKSDINDVVATGGTTAYFCGGGGFIRKTTDVAVTYSFQLNPMLADLYDLHFYDANKGWACSRKNSAVLRTTDGGTTWSLPTGTTVGYSWVQKFSGSSIGNTFVIDPWNRDRIFVAMSNAIYLSANRGDTWALQSGKTAGGGAQHSFYISPKDSNVWLVASTGSPEGVKRSTDRGVTWTSVRSGPFSSYGMPLEMDPDHPDTVFFAPDGTSGANGIVYRSTDFGVTWNTWANTSFRSPCDIVVVPESTSIMYVGDGVTGSGQGQMWRSTNSGLNWSSIYTTTGSEIPMIGISRHRNTEAFATAWGSGGVTKTSNLGVSWPSVATTGSTWGADVAKDDPNVIMYGVYGGSTSYLSTNAGASFISTSLTGSNGGLLCYDRGTFLVHQASNGVWKYVITYTVPTNNAQTVSLISPDGGQTWQGGTTYNVTWSVSNISNVKLEYTTSPGGAWQLITASTPATTGSYPWACPYVSSTQVRIRVGDATDSAPFDSSTNVFTIEGALPIQLLGFSARAVNNTVVLDWSTLSELNNYGFEIQTSVQDSLHYFSVPNGFVPGHGTTNVPHVYQFTVINPPVEAFYRLKQIDLDGSTWYSDGVLVAMLTGVNEREIPSVFAVYQNYPNPFNPSTTIGYDVPVAGHVSVEIFNMLGEHVATLVNEILLPGRHSVLFNGEGIPSGLYFYRLKTESYSVVKRMVLMK